MHRDMEQKWNNFGETSPAFIKTLNSSLNLHVINALFYTREYSFKTLVDTISRFIFLVRTWQDPLRVLSTLKK